MQPRKKVDRAQNLRVHSCCGVRASQDRRASLAPSIGALIDRLPRLNNATAARHVYDAAARPRRVYFSRSGRARAARREDSSNDL